MIGRRGFLGTLAAAGVGATVAPSVTSIFDAPVAVGAVGAFETWVTVQLHMLGATPRVCGTITSIGVVTDVFQRPITTTPT